MTHTTSSPHRLLIVALLAIAHGAWAQSPAGIDYTLRVDSARGTTISVDMRIRAAPAEFRLAMVAHPEYDDEYWRFLTDIHGESRAGPVRITREDSSLWRLSGAAGDVTLHYRVHFPSSPPRQQLAWKAHLLPTGGLIGGPHSFLYMPGAEHVPVTIDVVVPPGSEWTIATGLDSIGPHTFAAAGAEPLVDSPMLVGPIRRWSFEIAGVPHHVNILGHPDGAQFDTSAFVAGVERIARETERMFGAMPYHRYEFLFEDCGFGALEHTNSVSMGALSPTLAHDPNSLFGQIAHEFFHTWNEVHLRPQTWIGVRRVAPEPNGELWWSEGVTLFYADLLRRRAGVPTPESTRVTHLEGLIGTYLGNPSHAAISPEATSQAFNKSPLVTGDYTPSMYTQGEALGAVMDMMIRSGSGGRRSLDDAMRAMTSRFTMERGFVGSDIEKAVADACGCDAHAFFTDYVRSARAIDFDRWLGAMGMRMTVTWSPARAGDGTPLPDNRLSPITGPDSSVLLKISSPASLWGGAGLHTGDRVESFDGQPIVGAPAFRAAMGRLHIGDSAHLVVTRGPERIDKVVLVTGYDRPTVRIEARADASPSQRSLFSSWVAGR